MPNEPKKRIPIGCFIAGCRCGTILAGVVMIVLVTLYRVSPLILSDWLYASGENQPTTSRCEFTKKGKNYSFSETPYQQAYEFEISRADFEEMCQKNGWTPFLAIESLASLPNADWNVVPRINNRRDKTLMIQRYRFAKPGHEHCTCQCSTDPTGTKPLSCYRAVSEGFYFERREANGGGVYVVFDSKNMRCYIYGNAF